MNLQDYLSQHHNEPVASTSHHHLRAEPTGNGNYAIFIKPLSSSVAEVQLDGQPAPQQPAPAAQPEQDQPRP